MLSQTATYGLAAAVHLAERADEGPVRVDDIASDLDVPRNYLSKILHTLVQHGILVSTRGPGGGFELARAPGDIRLAEVVAPLEPKLMHRNGGGCLLGREKCRDDDPCAAHERWKQVSTSMLDFFTETTLDHLVAA